MKSGEIGPTRLLHDLRLHTARIHSDLEATALSHAVLSEQVTISSIAEFLQASYDCYAVLESAVSRALSPERLADLWAYSVESPVIAKDLAELAATYNIWPEAIATHHQQQAEAPYYIGGLYVLNGAQFGKRVIARHLQRQEHPLANCCRYFAAGGNSHGWEGFIRGAKHQVLDESSIALARQGADDFFSVFLRRWQSSSAGPVW